MKPGRVSKYDITDNSSIKIFNEYIRSKDMIDNCNKLYKLNTSCI